MKTPIVKCGLWTWTVEEVPNLRDEKGDLLDGLCQSDEHPKKIKIRSELGPSDKASTLLHEMIHAGEKAIGVDLTEKRVLQVETILGMLIHQNQELFREILKQLR